jgi:hypothetical protein
MLDSGLRAVRRGLPGTTLHHTCAEIAFRSAIPNAVAVLSHVPLDFLQGGDEASPTVTADFGADMAALEASLATTAGTPGARLPASSTPDVLPRIWCEVLSPTSPYSAANSSLQRACSATQRQTG